MNCAILRMMVAGNAWQVLSDLEMTQPASINPRIIESLYCEALSLSDDVRSTFTLSGRIEHAGREDDLQRVALSCEALRTTTRMMHAMAWLLNHRAYFMGELSEFQLRRHGRLTEEVATADPVRMVLLPVSTRELISATERFYARLLRLDQSWRQREPGEPSAVDRLRQRLSKAVGA